MKMLILSALAAAVLSVSAGATDPPREANVILAEYLLVRVPAFDRTKVGDQAYLRSHSEASRKATAKRNELALEFYRSYPKDERATQLMLTRWRSMTGPDSAQADEEMAAFLEDHPNSKVKADVLYSRAMLAAGMNGVLPPNAPHGREVEDFIQAYPQDARGGHLLLMVARGRLKTAEEKKAILGRIIADYPGSQPARMAEGSIRRIDSLGQPFALTFSDAIHGNTVTMKALQGKVVVIDFWATWCGPCIAEMPKMKELYAKYKDQGVEFIGVSLDLPGEGLAKLKKYVEANEMHWPQYYQGKGWDSEFSQSWGINSIPALFIVDADGNLHSTEARAKLESLIPELIKKRDQKS